MVVVSAAASVGTMRGTGGEWDTKGHDGDYREEKASEEFEAWGRRTGEKAKAQMRSGLESKELLGNSEENGGTHIIYNE